MRKNAYPVRDMETGEDWPSVNAAAKALGVNPNAVRTAILNHWACRGRYLVFDVVDAYCACCREKLESNLVKAGRSDLAQEVAAMVG